MYCRYIQYRNGVPAGCGRCMPCRIKKSGEVKARIMFEAMTHDEVCSLTLTYSEENLPYGGNLRCGDLRDWLKRFRSAVSPRIIRFYAVGEYGDENGRPHYHVVAFGWPSCRWGKSTYSKSKDKCCEACDLVLETWKLGLIQNQFFDEGSASYVSRYVTKKITKESDFRLEGLVNEFTRSSLKPGLGHAAAVGMAASIRASGVLLEDVPNSVLIGKKRLPLDRYMRAVIRKELGIEETAKAFGRQSAKERLLVVHESAKNTSTAEKIANPLFVVAEVNKGKRDALVFRASLFNKRSKI